MVALKRWVQGQWEEFVEELPHLKWVLLSVAMMIAVLIIVFLNDPPR